MTFSLHRRTLHYGGDVVLHTATSGAIAGLDELYLRLEAGADRGWGSVRINIDYLSGIPAARVVSQVVERCRAWQTLDDIHALRRHLETDEALSRPARALFDQTLADAEARRAGLPLARWLNPQATAARIESNQTLFWGDEATLDGQARRYRERGFRELKLRVGVADFDTDLRRIAQVRRIVGAEVALAIDVNGGWSPEQAAHYLERLAPLALDYVEQPLPAGDWDGLAWLASRHATPLLLDESLASHADIDALASQPLHVGAHLKLVKLGGVTPLMAAAKRVLSQGRRLMIGQMNEGAAATATAAHCAIALGATRGELYGADGLIDDPFTGLRYANGSLDIPMTSGIGLEWPDALDAFSEVPA
ncbi:mandelate racemase/muconate lactonizing enzyme family protein [Salinicola rhizosphaerae]|uniref:Chloromuconate cycloisomerase n=1 Tax=Salinicola rhizosphaerae TaxID=1443141 RepID=A0ABQ3DTX1_9GAMM|nr:enolase C-terminal domain-like protein [Salinicola rhizosphaerae]GHB14583.1 chloromuconate cycloisomerase [Salinicola rhizosphaerae]